MSFSIVRSEDFMKKLGNGYWSVGLVLISLFIVYMDEIFYLGFI